LLFEERQEHARRLHVLLLLDEPDQDLSIALALRGWCDRDDGLGVKDELVGFEILDQAVAGKPPCLLLAQQGDAGGRFHCIRFVAWRGEFDDILAVAWGLYASVPSPRFAAATAAGGVTPSRARKRGRR